MIRPDNYIVDSESKFRNEIPTMFTIVIDHTDVNVEQVGLHHVHIRHCRYCSGCNIFCGFMPHVSMFADLNHSGRNGQCWLTYEAALKEGLEIATEENEEFKNIVEAEKSHFCEPQELNLSILGSGAWPLETLPDSHFPSPPTSDQVNLIRLGLLAAGNTGK